MSIPVTCPNCHKRFKVSEKFAGQTGPCPSCKKPIKVPEKEEEVVIHAPEEFGPKDASGQAVLKPVEREETKITPVMIVGIVAACLASVAVVFFLGRAFDGAVPNWILGVGAALFGPPLALAGYALLRDHELEPHRGASLLVRCIICGLVYAALWGVYFIIKGYLLEGNVEMFQLVFIVPPLVGAGAVAGWASLELEFLNAALHYGIYLAATVLLRLLMDMPAF